MSSISRSWPPPVPLAVLLACLAALVIQVGGPALAAGDRYSVGIVPQFEARRLHGTWRPILDAVEARTGLRLSLKGSPTIPAFEREFMAGGFDFAYMNPYHVVLAHETEGYVPLVRDVGRTLHGVLVVRADSPYQGPSELAGQVVAFPAPNALGASLQMRQELTDHFQVPIQPRYVKTHDSVYLAVALGQTAAGGGVQKTLDRQPPAVRDQLRVIHTTSPVPPHPLVAHPRVPAPVRETVRAALLALGAEEPGRALLDRVPITRIGPARMEDYAPLAAMGLQRFDHLSR